ncbi:hypothetical protein [Streptomyces lichenis]|uniref:DUF4232 domain-containing protein n=1 Tax=Streptomyces lichenis TaxID=2306967 RepID=A0ABT0IFK4_9ACTN|nr:hypothetical protein [Streptomyces lichenis]MCK8680111.1 hypothetical protein [Streptomyces lichenis]
MNNSPDHERPGRERPDRDAADLGTPDHEAPADEDREPGGREHTPVDGPFTTFRPLSFGPAGPAASAEGSGADDELELRRMLRGAVQGLTPTEGSLDHLRRAVPARRARKRQAVVGMAAAALLFGTAVPALVHVAASPDTTEDFPVNAGHGQHAQDGPEGSSKSADGGGGTTGGGQDGPRTEEKSPSREDRDGTPSPHPSAEAATGSTADGTVGEGAGRVGTAAPVSTPVCQADQLGSALADLARPDPEGRVYGTFRVTNTSPTACAVGAVGAVGFATTGAADPAKVSVLRHTAGDAAAGLPDPAQEAAAPLLLQPSGSYEVKFAWVPAETCPVDGGSQEPSPEPTTPPTEEPPTTGGGTDTADTGTGTQLQRADGGLAEGGVTVTHTAEQGSPTAAATITEACAGAIYHTGVLAPS